MFFWELKSLPESDSIAAHGLLWPIVAHGYVFL